MRVLLAWGVHLLTAAGAALGLIALLAIGRNDPGNALRWMALAVVVDGLDGVLARWICVEELAMRIDGGLLDNMVDYLNYAAVPAYFLAAGELLPSPWRIPTAAIILMASAYQFAQIDAKTADRFFTGFPSYWNVAVFYLFVLQISQVEALVTVGLLVVLVFVPIRWIYPTRAQQWRGAILITTLLWGATCLVALAAWPQVIPGLVEGSLLYPAFYLGASLYLGGCRRS